MPQNMRFPHRAPACATLSPVWWSNWWSYSDRTQRAAPDVCWASRSRAQVSGSRVARIQRIAKGVAQQVQAQHNERDRQGRTVDQPRAAREAGRRVAQHVAPRGKWRLNAQTQKREGGLDENQVAELDRDERAHERHDVWQKVAQHESPVRRSNDTCRDDELTLSQRQR